MALTRGINQNQHAPHAVCKIMPVMELNLRRQTS
jgi:hypothetical protein